MTDLRAHFEIECVDGVGNEEKGLSNARTAWKSDCAGRN